MRLLSKFRHHPTQVLIALLALAGWVLVIQHYFPVFSQQAYAASSPVSSKTLNRLNVHRINVKDNDGTTRLVISNHADFPPPIVRGKKYIGWRSIHPAGMVFYNKKGNETGGLGITKTRNGGNGVGLIFDYVYQPTDGISMSRTASANGKHWEAGFSISDRRPYHSGKVKSSQGVKRVSLHDKNGDAELIIYDAKGRPRIRIGVGKNGKPHIQILNAAGDVTYNALPNRQGSGK